MTDQRSYIHALSSDAVEKSTLTDRHCNDWWNFESMKKVKIWNSKMWRGKIRGENDKDRNLSYPSSAACLDNPSNRTTTDDDNVDTRTNERKNTSERKGGTSSSMTHGFQTHLCILFFIGLTNLLNSRDKLNQSKRNIRCSVSFPTTSISIGQSSLLSNHIELS